MHGNFLRSTKLWKIVPPLKLLLTFNILNRFDRFMRISSLLIFAVSFFTPNALIQEVTNEIQSPNFKTIADEDGGYSDWLEVSKLTPFISLRNIYR